MGLYLLESMCSSVLYLLLYSFIYFRLKLNSYDAYILILFFFLTEALQGYDNPTMAYPYYNYAGYGGYHHGHM